MRLSYISSQFISLSLALTVTTLLAQVNTFHGLDCYVCVFYEFNGAAISNHSVTCENNPTEAELLPVTGASLANSAEILQVLKGMNPSSISSSNLLNSDNEVATLNVNSETDVTDLYYCTLSIFNLQGFGRVVLRLAARAVQDLGDTYCDNTLPSGTGFDLLPTSNVDNCYCKVSGCNGKPITTGGSGGGADKAGQSIALLVFSIGIASLALISFGQ